MSKKQVQSGGRLPEGRIPSAQQAAEPRVLFQSSKLYLDKPGVEPLLHALFSTNGWTLNEEPLGRVL